MEEFSKLVCQTKNKTMPAFEHSSGATHFCYINTIARAVFCQQKQKYQGNYERL